MTMPVSRNSAHPFPIEVTQNDAHFMVRIPAKQKERASRIPGRRWIPEIERWVYPKTIQVFEALRDEFEKDASVFGIRKPPSKRLPTPQPHSDPNDQSLDEWKDLSEKTSDIHEKFINLGEQISAILGSVLSVETIARETQEMVRTKDQKSLHPTTEEKTSITSLDPTKPEELKVLEKALVLLAYASSGQDRSFAQWISTHRPLFQPYAFVADTHEKIKGAIAAIVGDPSYRKKGFHNLVQELKDRDVIDPQLIYLLLAMNQHRNRFGHPENFTESERLSRSIIYLFNLALVWPHIASEPVEESDET